MVGSEDLPAEPDTAEYASDATHIHNRLIYLIYLGSWRVQWHPVRVNTHTHTHTHTRTHTLTHDEDRHTQSHTRTETHTHTHTPNPPPPTHTHTQRHPPRHFVAVAPGASHVWLTGAYAIIEHYAGNTGANARIGVEEHVRIPVSGSHSFHSRDKCVFKHGS